METAPKSQQVLIIRWIIKIIYTKFVSFITMGHLILFVMSEIILEDH